MLITPPRRLLIWVQDLFRASLTDQPNGMA